MSVSDGRLDKNLYDKKVGVLYEFSKDSRHTVKYFARRMKKRIMVPSHRYRSFKLAKGRQGRLDSRYGYLEGASTRGAQGTRVFGICHSRGNRGTLRVVAFFLA